MDTNGQMDEHMVLAVGEQGCHAILYPLTLLIFCGTYLNVSKQK